MTDRLTGTALAFYPCGALDDAAKRALTLAQPSLAMPHQGPEGLQAHAPAMARDIRALVPTVRLLVGVGCDTWTDRAVKGQCTTSKAVDEILLAADVAASIGAVGVVYDPEGASEGAMAKSLAGVIATAVIAGTRQRHPSLLIGHTSYDGPCAVVWRDGEGREHSWGGHGAYPWAEWCGAAGADIDLPQVYWAGGSAGSGPWRLARHRDSWAKAESLGWIAPDRQHAVYVQAHGSTVEDLCTVTDQFSLRAWWAANSDETFDAPGLLAFRAMCALERMALDVRAFQARAGLVADGAVGPRTLAALGVS